ncbi:MAG: hypothetical protein ACKVPX_06045, partial [Myxococcaceae bacterium]
FDRDLFQEFSKFKDPFPLEAHIALAAAIRDTRALEKKARIRAIFARASADPAHRVESLHVLAERASKHEANLRKLSEGGRKTAATPEKVAERQATVAKNRQAVFRAYEPGISMAEVARRTRKNVKTVKKYFAEAKEAASKSAT